MTREGTPYSSVVEAVARARSRGHGAAGPVRRGRDRRARRSTTGSRARRWPGRRSGASNWSTVRINAALAQLRRGAAARRVSGPMSTARWQSPLNTLRRHARPTPPATLFGRVDAMCREVAGPARRPARLQRAAGRSSTRASVGGGARSRSMREDDESLADAAGGLPRRAAARACSAASASRSGARAGRSRGSGRPARDDPALGRRRDHHHRRRRHRHLRQPRRARRCSGPTGCSAPTRSAARTRRCWHTLARREDAPERERAHRRARTGSSRSSPTRSPRSSTASSIEGATAVFRDVSAAPARRAPDRGRARRRPRAGRGDERASEATPRARPGRLPGARTGSSARSGWSTADELQMRRMWSPHEETRRRSGPSGGHERTFARGEGLAGTAWAAREPVCDRGRAGGRPLRRTPRCRAQRGLRAALAVPILSDGTLPRRAASSPTTRSTRATRSSRPR